MTYDELKATGKSGVYRADLDEWFIEGEEPPLPSPVKTESVAPLKPAPEPNDEPVAPAAAVKTTKGGKHNDNS